MNLIFLDIDGVLNSSSYAKKHYEETGKGLFMYDFVDSSRVELLLSFLNIHDGDVGLVISSSWRENTLNDTISFFKEHELVAPLAKYIVGITPRLYNDVRGDEIDWFLNSIERSEIEKFAIKSLEIDRFCIVDDEDDMLDYQFDNFIHVDSYVGLTESDIDKIEELLYER
jgi:hypothetical protein